MGSPIAAQQVITVGVNMMDNIMLVQLDETAMTASAMAVQVHDLFHFMCMGLSVGAGYFRWSLPCFFLYVLSLATTNTLRNGRQTRIPVLTSIGTFFINIFFNWAFIFGRLGAPAAEDGAERSRA